MKVRFYIIILSLLICFSQAHADSKLSVVVSIKPYHSLVSGVMLGVANPELLLKGNFSPHHYSMKPSDAEILQNADIVFWGGENLEIFLAKPIISLSKKAIVVSMLRINGLNLKFFRDLRNTRKSNIFYYYDSNLSNDQDNKKQTAIDPHIWLDPENAKIIINGIVSILSKYDPENSKKYKENGEKIKVRLNVLDQLILSELNEISDRTFLVLHDAFQYFEIRYQLKSEGSITLNLNHFLGVRRLKKVKNMIKRNEISCIFGEPQYSQKVVESLIDGTSVKKGILDPIGTNLQPGPNLYFDLMKNMSISIKSCLN